MLKTLVRKRCFVQMIGYEVVGAEHQRRRFVREMARFHTAWNLRGTAYAPRLAADGLVASWRVETAAPNWRVDTEYHYFRWDDFVAADACKSDWRRLPAGVATMMEFIFTGTVYRYAVASWRYVLFFTYPLLAIAGIIGLSILASQFVVARAGLPNAALLTSMLAFPIFVALWLISGWTMSLRYAFDDWLFARDLIYRKRPQIEERIDRFAYELVRLVRSTGADEIVVHGHSLGAPFALMVIDRALQIDPQLGRRGKPLHLVSAGSSLLKLALHPAAGWLREMVGRVANAPGVDWVELQALADVINMYKVDPVAALGIPAAGKPIIKLIRIRLMLEEATYSRLRLNFLRLHRQAVMGNERRYFYDYYMLCCGPISLADRVADPDEVVAAFAANGALPNSWQTWPSALSANRA